MKFDEKVHLGHAYVSACPNCTYISREKTRVSFKLTMAMGHSTIAKKVSKVADFLVDFELK